MLAVHYKARNKNAALGFELVIPNQKTDLQQYLFIISATCCKIHTCIWEDSVNDFETL